MSILRGYVMLTTAKQGELEAGFTLQK